MRRRTMAAGSRIWRAKEFMDDKAALHELDAGVVYDTITRPGIRMTNPYWHEYKTNAKERWVGERLIDVFSREFAGSNMETVRRSFEEGRISVNGTVVRDVETVVREGDEICHEVIRIENIVSSESPRIVYEDKDLGVLIVNKPPTIPVHPTGRFRYCSLLHILRIEQKQPYLWFVHRLDRLTSGLMVLATKHETVSQMATALSDRAVCKSYLARVLGRFPGSAAEAHEEWGELDWEGVKDAVDHAINWKPEELREGEEKSVGGGGAIALKGRSPMTVGVEDRGGAMLELETEELIRIVEDEKPTLTEQLKERAERAEKVRKEVMETIRSSVPLKGFMNIEGGDEGGMMVRVGAPLYTENTQFPPTVCSLDGKPSESLITRLSYDEDTDTSVVAVRICTGRMHQIRAHLMWLGFPVALDMQYNLKRGPDGVWDRWSAAADILYYRSIRSNNGKGSLGIPIPLVSPDGILLHSFQFRAKAWPHDDKDGVIITPTRRGGGEGEGAAPLSPPHSPSPSPPPPPPTTSSSSSSTSARPSSGAALLSRKELKSFRRKNKMSFSFTAPVPAWAVGVGEEEARMACAKLFRVAASVPANAWDDARRAKIKARQMHRAEKVAAKRARRAARRAARSKEEEEERGEGGGGEE